MQYMVGFGFGPALLADGNTGVLTLTKGDSFDAWVQDTLVVRVNDGPVGDVPAWVLNRQKVHELVDAWLDGVDYDV